MVIMVLIIMNMLINVYYNQLIMCLHEIKLNIKHYHQM